MTWGRKRGRRRLAGWITASNGEAEREELEERAEVDGRNGSER